MLGKLNSDWNLTVVKLLRDCFKEHNNYSALSLRNNVYIEDLFVRKIKTLRTIWHDTQPKKNANDSFETVAQLEQRLLIKKDMTMKANRMSTQWENVSTVALDQTM